MNAAQGQDEVGRLLQRAADRHRAGDLETAEKDYLRVLKRRPNDPDALHLLGVLELQRGIFDKAARFLDRALAVRHDFADAHFHRALLAHRTGDKATAERHLRSGIALRPTAIEERFNLCGLLADQGRVEEANADLRTLIAQHPTLAEAHKRLSRNLRLIGETTEMLKTAQIGLQHNPLDSILHLLTAEAHFERGELREGWHAYNWRFKSSENPIPAKTYALPSWQGESLNGRRILVWAEQAPGDEIMYAHMLPDLIAQAQACGLQCSPRIAPIMRRSFPTVQVFDRNLTPSELSGFDVQVAAGSMGEWLRPDFAAFKSHDGYLRADENLTAQFRKKYEALGNGRFLVGIAWRSSGVENANDKSVSLLDWGPILQVPNVTFVNLQYGDCLQELNAAAKGFGARILHDNDVDPLRDMDTFAAQTAAMDLVISSSNTAAHVAGALGVPTLCMLPRTLGTGRRWYWFPLSATCPWYPSLQRFYQRHDAQWLDVIRDTGLALLDIATQKGVVEKQSPYLRALGQAFANAGRPADAEHLYRHMARDPACRAEALYHIADQRRAAGAKIGGGPEARRLYEEAIGFFDEAIAADPAFWHAYNGKGIALTDLLRFEDAVATYTTGLTYAPASPQIHNNLANALRKAGRCDQALLHFQEGHRLAPDVAPIHLGLASTLDELDRPDEAIASFDALVARNPDYVDAHYNRAQALLSAGRFEEGWKALPWRLKRPSANVRYEAFPQPIWQGQDLAGKRILVWTEQGIGDEILTASMLADAAEKAERVTLLCSERLVPLMRRSFPNVTVAERKEPLPEAARKSSIAWQMSLSELGLAFRRTWRDFPKQERFLVPDTDLRDRLRQKYQAHRPGTRLVGLSWRSPSNPEVGWLKGDLELTPWAPLFTAGKDVTFVNLQYGDCQAALARAQQATGVEVLHDPAVDPLKDMDVFAAQVAAMDLVISSSNTTVHTAGALGVPTWVMLPKGRGRMWYWFRDRMDSPWYPSVRLMRQPVAGDWNHVYEHCARELKAWLAG